MMVMAGGNPFDYQRPLTPATELIDRREELDALQRAAADRIAVRLASPRRFGKTSLLRAHLAVMREAGHRTAYVDFDRVATVADVADRLVDGLRGLPVDPERRIERRLRRLGISLGPAGLMLQVAPREPARTLGADEARAAVRDLLAIPGELGDDGGLTVVAMDEFQDLLTADDRLDGVLRSVIQHQEHVAHVFAGSSPSLMRELFTDRERPFYGQARPVELPPLPEDETFRYVRDRLPAHPQRDAAAGVLVQFAEGHPQRTMLLAHHLFERLDRGAGWPGAGEDPAADAVDAALAELDDLFASVWTGLTPPERTAVAALADGLSPASRRVAQEHGTARSTLQRVVERLERDGQIVVRAGGVLRLLDPLFGEWLRRR
jgi:hypothetical protein